ncbi:MAG TPA: S9 family peptidase [Polyangiaceae bacterium]|nr:S9 family peptidase [Polyangiaceae bacterium]
MSQGAGKPFEVDDLLSFKLIADMTLSPDGRLVVYVLQEVDAGADDYSSNLWSISTDGGPPRQLTFGPDSNQSPRFSPDGSRLAFLSNRGGGPPQLYAMRVDGGEAKRLTDLKAGAGPAAWSPDGERIAFSAPVAPEGPPHAPKVVTKAFYKTDGVGFLLNSPTHLFVVPAEGGEAEQITRGEASESSPAWSPDGRSLAFSRTRTGARDAHRSDLWAADAAGGNERQVTNRCAIASMPSWSPDGRRIAFYGTSEDGDSRQQLWAVRAAGGDERRLSSEDTEVASFPLGKSTPPAWSADGSELALVLATESLSEVALVPAEGGAPRPVVSDERQITQLSAAPGAGRLAFLWSDLRLCAQLGASRWDGSEQVRLLNANRDWAKGRAWPEVELREFPGAAEAKNLGLLLLPPGRGGRRCPLLVDVHGGPHAYVSLGFSYHPYWYALVSRGWAVLALNPVGSGAFGKEFSDRLRGRWGERDLPEQLAAVDALVREGVADGDRVAIAGKSYGGYMAAWAVGKTKRFRAAVCSAPVTNLESHFGTSDSGYYVDPFDMRGEPFDERERYFQLSPVRCAGAVETPTLLLQGEDDQRCPVGQAEEFFALLVRAGKAPVEFVRYPGGDHHLAEKGRPSHRVDYHRRIVDWLEAHCATRSRGG